MKSNPI